MAYPICYIIRVMSPPTRDDTAQHTVATFDGAPKPGHIDFGVGQPSADVLPLELVHSACDRFFVSAEALELATQTGRQEPDIALSLGTILCNLKRWRDARDVFSRVVLNNPQSAEARYLLALTAGELGDYTTALPMLQRAVEIDPVHARRRAVETRLRYLYEEGQRVNRR